MTIPRMNDLATYWKAHPPLHLMVQSYLGIKGEAKPVEPSSADREEQLGQLISMFQGGAIHG